MKHPFVAPKPVRSSAVRPPSSAIPTRVAWQGPILFYDHRCSVCRRFIAWVVDADHSGSLRIAPLHGVHFELVRAGHPEFDARRSAIWFPRHGPPRSQSDAILAVFHYLGGGWKILATLGRLIPRAWRDKAYRAFATHRGRFGWLGLQTLDPRTLARILPEEPRRGAS